MFHPNFLLGRNDGIVEKEERWRERFKKEGKRKKILIIKV